MADAFFILFYRLKVFQPFLNPNHFHNWYQMCFSSSFIGIKSNSE